MDALAATRAAPAYSRRLPVEVPPFPRSGGRTHHSPLSRRNGGGVGGGGLSEGGLFPRFSQLLLGFGPLSRRNGGGVGGGGFSEGGIRPHSPPRVGNDAESAELRSSLAHTARTDRPFAPAAGRASRRRRVRSRRQGCQQPRRLRSAREVQLRQNVAQVILHRKLRQHEALRDLFVR